MPPRLRVVELDAVQLHSQAFSHFEKWDQENMNTRSETKVALWLACQCALVVTVFGATNAGASVWCNVTNYSIDAYDHGGVYLSGDFGGIPKQFITLCDKSWSCDSRTTDRRYAMAPTAHVTTTSLKAYFDYRNSSDEVKRYDRITSLTIQK